MSELKDYKVYTTRHEGAWGYHYEPNPNNQSDIELNGEQVYLKKDADKVIAEKDQEIAELKKKLMPCLNGDCILTCEVVEKYGKENAELKAKLEDAKASHYAEMVDAGMRERKMKRALWLARAERAKDRATTCNDFAYLGDTKREINMTLARTWMKCRMLKPSEWSKVWNNVERKCRDKAEEYK
jgi:hypothetical protein